MESRCCYRRRHGSGIATHRIPVERSDQILDQVRYLLPYVTRGIVSNQL